MIAVKWPFIFGSCVTRIKSVFPRTKAPNDQAKSKGNLYGTGYVGEVSMAF